MRLREATRGLCDPIWLIDAQDPAALAVLPILQRSGPVVQTLGMAVEDVAASLRPLKPDGLATFYDTGMAHVAAVAQALGLPFHGVHAARALEDKYHQREALRAGGLPTPAVVAIPAGTDQSTLNDLSAQVSYPAMFKPRRASGSWHTFRVDSEVELHERLAELGGELLEEMILEGYLPDGPEMPGGGFEADYVSVETVAVGGELTHLAITGRFPLAEPFRETGFFIPSTLEGDLAQSVLEVAGQALTAVGVHTGCTHTEVKLTAEGPLVIEINGRIGGGVPEMLKLSSGIDMIQLAMRAALTMDLGVSAMPMTHGVAYRFFFQPPATARRLLSMSGLDELRRQSGVEDVYLHVSPGSELDAADGTRTYLFAVVGAAVDHAGVVAMDEYLAREISVEYEHEPASVAPPSAHRTDDARPAQPPAGAR
jgi:biotin carboxylase